MCLTVSLFKVILYQKQYNNDLIGLRVSFSLYILFLLVAFLSYHVGSRLYFCRSILSELKL